MKEWKKIRNANIVTVHEAFTTREFGDSSLIFSFDYHPLSKTLQEQHLQPVHGSRYRAPSSLPENVLWGYICQITNALKTIHSNKLAARCLEPSKIIISDNNRIRLSACSILDVVQFESNTKSVQELQQEDLVKFGKLILSLTTTTPPAHLNNIPVALESLAAKYSANLRDAVAWLIAPPNQGEPKSIENFISGIASHMTTFFDLALQDNDEKQSHLARELENGRAARIMMKLMTIVERGELGGAQAWSETGDRYQLKLFRDYVFHRVDADGDVVPGDALLCGHPHGDDLHVHFLHAVDDRDDQVQTGAPHLRLDAPEPEHDPGLVLLDDPHAPGHRDDQGEAQDHEQRQQHRLHGRHLLRRPDRAIAHCRTLTQSTCKPYLGFGLWTTPANRQVALG